MRARDRQMDEVKLTDRRRYHNYHYYFHRVFLLPPASCSRKPPISTDNNSPDGIADVSSRCAKSESEHARVRHKRTHACFEVRESLTRPRRNDKSPYVAGRETSCAEFQPGIYSLRYRQVSTAALDDGIAYLFQRRTNINVSVHATAQ